MSQHAPHRREGQMEGEMAAISPHIQHQWPALGQELVAREQRLASASTPDQHAWATQEHLRQETLAQLYQAEGQYSRATRYLAFLLVKYGRGAEVVGNPVAVSSKGMRFALPYTGLEGYYAGSVSTASFPGLSQSDMLYEEASSGIQIVKRLKKDAVEHNTWAEYVHLRHVLEGKEQKRVALKTLQTLWITLVSQLRGRVYHHPEFEQTITERIERGEQMLAQRAQQSTERLHVLRTEQNRLKEAYALLGEEEKTGERNERKRRENIRRARITVFQQFRDETYHILEVSNQDHYDVSIQDSAWDKATLIETIVLPRLPARETYPLIEVHFTPEELDGYLFLAQLGEIGADPLARCDLVTRGSVE